MTLNSRHIGIIIPQRVRINADILTFTHLNLNFPLFPARVIKGSSFLMS